MERAELFSNGGINYTDAMERFGGNEALFIKLAIKFLDDTHFSSLENALAENNTEEAYRQAHSLKGVAGNLSFETLYKEIGAISTMLHEGNIASAKDSLPVAQKAYIKVIETLRMVSQQQ